MPKGKFIKDGQAKKGGPYIRVWKEGRQSIMVQVWLSGNPVGKPDGDWEMPAVLGVEVCIAQAILQTKRE